MSKRYPGGIVSRSTPSIVGPTDVGAGLEGGSAPGIWTLEQVAQYTKLNVWPRPWQQRQLYGWSTNTSGELGLNDILLRSSPTQIGSTVDWLKMHRASGCTIALKVDGTLWAWGNGNNGELGQNDRIARSSPVQIGSQNNWSDIVAAGGGKLALKSDGTLWAWGSNNHGQLGQNNVIYRSSPVQIGSENNWSKVSSGSRNLHHLAIKTDGTLWAWGNNTWGQLGINTNTSRSSPVQVGTQTNWLNTSCGESHSVAIKTDGSIWSWGSGTNFGELGQNSTINRSSPVQVGALTNWSKITTGQSSTMVIKTDGTLWAWGYNGFGVLGDNTVIYRSSPVQIGTQTNWLNANVSVSTSCLAVKTDGTLWAWGVNSGGQLGQNDIVSRSAPTQVGALATWIIPYSDNTGLAINAPSLEKSNLWVAGNNISGQLLQGDSTYRSSPVLVSSRVTWASVSGQGNAVLAIKTNGTLWSGGQNQYGELGLNDRITRSAIVQVGSGTNWSSVSMGSLVSCAVKTDGTLWSWGYNQTGELGQNISYAVNRSSPVQIGALTTWAKVSAGSAWAAAIKTDGTLWVWGSNANGRLGLNIATTINRSSPVQVGTDNNWSTLGANSTFALATKTDGTLWSWGLNNLGQLGLNDTVNRSSPVQVGALTNWSAVSGMSGIIALKTDGTLWSWGNNNDGSLGLGDRVNRSSPVQVGTLTTWSKISASAGHASAVKTDGTLWAWGQNNLGQLGLNDRVYRSSPVQLGSLTYWTNVFTGSTEIYALSN